MIIPKIEGNAKISIPALISIVGSVLFIYYLALGIKLHKYNLKKIEQETK